MLNSIKLTNFRKHTSSEFTFIGGLTAIRGPNEGAKSTILEGICYALFGVGALRSPLADAVTWGEAENTLKVVVQFTADGVTYEVRRGKSGAEVNYDGGMVTGQKEVTAFICRLLKVDAVAASRLMLANQNEIRGALEAGPKATTELIERLAEFDQIDRLIDLIQTHLTIGSTKVAEDALARAQETLASAQELAKAPDTKGLNILVDSYEISLMNAERDLESAKVNERMVQERHAAAREQAVKHAEAVRTLDKAQAQVQDMQQRTAALGKVRAPSGSESALRDQIESAEGHEQLRATYLQVEPYLQEPSGPRIEGGVEGLEEAVETDTANATKVRNLVTQLTGDLRLQQTLLTHGTCSFCGKDFSGVPEVEEKNAEVRAQIANLEKMLADATSQAEMWDKSRDEALAIQRASKAPLRLLSAHPDLVEAVDDLMPPQLRWLKEVPSEAGADVESLRSDLRELKAAQRKYDEDQAALAALQPLLAKAKEDLEAAKAAVSAAPEVYLPQDELDEARGITATAEKELRAARDRLTQAKQALKDANDGHTRALQALHDAQEVVSARSAEIDALVFNNTLLKKVRTARPAIADRLWAIVLKAVSGYFSEIRGTRSRVTKDSDGFKVDGHSVSTLSGSTLDALGLAIRVALVRTFLPSAPFLILDEPAAAMDEGRTHNMLGFISSAGFSQVILVTHEDVSESVADNIIQL